jgi:hypothetical protein
MNDVIKQKTIPVDLRINIGGPPLSRFDVPDCATKIYPQKAAKQRKQKIFVPFFARGG